MRSGGHESQMSPQADSVRLWRAALHDMNNALGGILGILELNPDPAKALPLRDRQRMEAVAREGLATVALAQALVLDRLPDSDSTEGEAWREGLNARLANLSTLHRCPVILTYRGNPEHDRWPGTLFQHWVAAVSRQVFPLVAPGPLGMVFEADDTRWRVRWTPCPGLPQTLRAEEDRPRELAAHFALALAERLGVRFEEEASGLVAVMPR